MTKLADAGKWLPVLAVGGSHLRAVVDAEPRLGPRHLGPSCGRGPVTEYAVLALLVRALGRAAAGVRTRRRCMRRATSCTRSSCPAASGTSRRRDRRRRAARRHRARGWAWRGCGRALEFGHGAERGSRPAARCTARAARPPRRGDVHAEPPPRSPESLVRIVHELRRSTSRCRRSPTPRSGSRARRCAAGRARP